MREGRQVLTVSSRVLNLLREVPESSVEELVGRLAESSCTVSLVERILFDHPDVFDHDGGMSRKWHVLSGRAFPIARNYLEQPLRKWQEHALQEWIVAGRGGVVEAVTGTGKTAVGVAAIADAYSRGLRSLVLVPGIDLMEQWHSVLQRAVPNTKIGRRGDKFRDTLVSHRILISTVQSAVRGESFPATSGCLLVADEVHRYGASAFARALTDDFQERLGLTATYERSDDSIDTILSPYFGSTIDGCDYRRGYEEGILAPVRVVNIAVQFTPKERHDYEDADERARSARTKLINNCGIPAEPFGLFMQEVDRLSNDENAGPATFLARKFMKAFNDRRSILAQSHAKLDLLRQIGSAMRGPARSILFSETVAAAEAAAAMIADQGVAAEAMTSGMKPAERAALLGRFRVGEVVALATPRLLDEGIDVPEAELGLILAASRSRRQMVQRMGRIIRPKHDGRHAIFAIVYVEGTSEDPASGAHETFLRQILDIADEVRSVSGADAAALLRRWLLERPEDVEMNIAAEVLDAAVKSDPTEFDPDHAAVTASESNSWTKEAILDVFDDFEGLATWDELIELLPDDEIRRTLMAGNLEGRVSWTLVDGVLVGDGGQDRTSRKDRVARLWALRDTRAAIAPNPGLKQLRCAANGTPLESVSLQRLAELWESLAGSSSQVLESRVDHSAPGVEVVADKPPKQAVVRPSDQELRALIEAIEAQGGRATLVENSRRTALTVIGSDGIRRVARVLAPTAGDWFASKDDGNRSLDDTHATSWIFVDPSEQPQAHYICSAFDISRSVRNEIDEWMIANPGLTRQLHPIPRSIVVSGRDRWDYIGCGTGGVAKTNIAVPRIALTSPLPKTPAKHATNSNSVGQNSLSLRASTRKVVVRTLATKNSIRIYMDVEGYRVVALYDQVGGGVKVTRAAGFQVLEGRTFADPGGAATAAKSVIAGDDVECNGWIDWIVDDGSGISLAQSVGKGR